MGLTEGTGLRDDPYRIAGVRLSGVRRARQDVGKGGAESTALTFPTANWRLRR